MIAGDSWRTMSTTTSELDIVLKRSLMLLHLPQTNTAAELRSHLDEEIRKRYGAEKMIIHGLRKKQLERESNFPGRASTPPPVEIINLINSPDKTISDSPNTILDSEEANESSQEAVVGSVTTMMSSSGLMAEGTTQYDESATNLRDFGDLNCCVCSEMMFTATNRLIECSKCSSLYHQACHKPIITDAEISDELLAHWLCDQCLNRPTTTKEAGLLVLSGDVNMEEQSGLLLSNPNLNPNPNSHPSPTIPVTTSLKTNYSSSSSNSSSPFYRSDPQPPPPPPPPPLPIVNVISKKSNNYSSSSSSPKEQQRTYSNTNTNSPSNNIKSHSSSLNPSSVSTSSSSSSNKRHSISANSPPPGNIPGVTTTSSKSRSSTRQNESRRRTHR